MAKGPLHFSFYLCASCSVPCLNSCVLVRAPEQPYEGELSGNQTCRYRRYTFVTRRRAWEVLWPREEL